MEAKSFQQSQWTQTYLPEIKMGSKTGQRESIQGDTARIEGYLIWKPSELETS